MIFSENRSTLFRILLQAALTLRQPCLEPAAKPQTVRKVEQHIVT
jgi:hypothetical protein